MADLPRRSTDNERSRADDQGSIFHDELKISTSYRFHAGRIQTWGFPEGFLFPLQQATGNPWTKTVLCINLYSPPRKVPRNWSPTPSASSGRSIGLRVPPLARRDPDYVSRLKGWSKRHSAVHHGATPVPSELLGSANCEGARHRRTAWVRSLRPELTEVRWCSMVDHKACVLPSCSSAPDNGRRWRRENPGDQLA